MRRRVLVAGLGNVLMGDDALGPYCIGQLLARYEFAPGVDVVDLGAPGLNLAHHLASADYVLAIDALRGVAPGTLAVYDDASIANAGRSSPGVRLESHSPALAESLAIARLTAERPKEMRLIGLGGACFDFGAAMTPAIRERVPALAALALEELARWHVPAPTPRPSPPEGWDDDAAGHRAGGR
jgi:hydrogenase maturation protease